VGDGACYTEMTGLGAGASLTFEKGGQAYTISVVLPFGASDATVQTAEKTLALDTAGKL
jgi:hypothetical protein